MPTKCFRRGTRTPVTPSPQVVSRLAEEQDGKPAVMSMSFGKDSLAAAIACRRAGIRLTYVHTYVVPPDMSGRLMPLIEEDRRLVEHHLDCQVHMYPGHCIYAWINRGVYCPPERLGVYEGARLPEPTHEQIWQLILDDLGLPRTTPIIDGVRCADSLPRRASMSMTGPDRTTHGVRRVSAVWDRLNAEVYEAIAGENIPLPADYRLFGRSFDGIDARFTGPLREHRPADYRHIIGCFPLAQADLIRHELLMGGLPKTKHVNTRGCRIAADGEY
nr:MAG TPA: GMP synthase [Caudoviricetes sp.]